MGSSFSGSPGQTNSTSVNQPPAWLQNSYQQLMNQAAATAQIPFQQYPGQFTAGLTQPQQSALGIQQDITNSTFLWPWLNQASQTMSGAGNTLGSASGLVGSAIPYLSGAGNIIGSAPGYINTAGGYVGTGTGLANSAAGTALTPMSYDISPYMSPYINDVVNATQAQFNNANAQQSNSLLGQAIAAGNAFGGDRAGVAQAQLAGQQQLAQAPVIANLYNQGFNQAQQEFNTQQAVNLQAKEQQLANMLQAAGINIQGANTMGGLGTSLAGIGSAYGGLGSQYGSLANTLGGIGAQQGSLGSLYGNLGLNTNQFLNSSNAQLFGMGTTQQQTQQADLNALYQQWLAQQGYPFQTLGWQAGIYAPLGAGMGGTSTTSGTQMPAFNPFSSMLGAGTALGSAALLAPAGTFAGWGSALAALPLLSDERAKENIEPVGKTFGGDMIYRFNYKGEQTKQLGLLAQEIEEKNPSAVSHDDRGMKYVDYEQATNDSVPHKQFGGPQLGTGLSGGGVQGGMFDPRLFVANAPGYVSKIAIPATARGLGIPSAGNAVDQSGLLNNNDPLKTMTDNFLSILKMSQNRKGDDHPIDIGSAETYKPSWRGGGIGGHFGFDDGGGVDDGMDDSGGMMSPYMPSYLAQANVINNERTANAVAANMLSKYGFAEGGNVDDGLEDYTPSFDISSLNAPGLGAATEPLRRAADPMAISEMGEVGRRGLAGQSNISPDTWGSRSYGVLGLNSRTGSASQFAKEYPELGLTANPGSGEFDAQWRRAAAEMPTELYNAQKNWHSAHVLNPVRVALAGEGINPDIGTDPRVLSYLADRRVQMGDVGWDHALELAKSDMTPEKYINALSANDRANIPNYFRSYLATHPQDAKGLNNRISLRERMSLGNENDGGQTDIPPSAAPVSGDRSAMALRVAQEPPQSPQRGLGMSPDTRKALALAGIAAGAAMMSGQSPHFMQNIGTGLLAGAKQFENVDQLQLAAKRAQAELNNQEELRRQGAERINLERGRLAEETRQHRISALQPVKIGQDMYGRDIFGVRDPNTEGYKIIDRTTGNTKPPGQVSAQAGDASAQPPLTGDDYLAELSAKNPSFANEVRAYVEGRSMPVGNARSDKVRAVKEAAAQYDPNFDESVFKSRQATRTDFSTGKAAQNVSALQTVMGHINDLTKKIDKLPQHNFQTLNEVENWLSTKFGSSSVTEFNIARDAVANEMAKIFRSTGMSETDIKEWKNTLSSAFSREQFKGAVDTAINLLESRQQALADQFNRGMALGPSHIKGAMKIANDVDVPLDRNITAEDLISQKNKEKLKHVRDWVSGADKTKETKDQSRADDSSPSQKFTGRTATNKNTGQTLRETTDGKWVP